MGKMGFTPRKAVIIGTVGSVIILVYTLFIVEVLGSNFVMEVVRSFMVFAGFLLAAGFAVLSYFAYHVESCRSKLAALEEEVKELRDKLPKGE